MDQYVAPERVNLKIRPEYDEKWVQRLIADNPKILGLGELVLLQQERIQPGWGRLDLLLQDAETNQRYEVELQLGTVDESHIIRTIEYWDIERKRYPQYDHCAVIIAEDITGRFLNVISLFNGTIPLIAIQMQAYKVGQYLTLVFTIVMNVLQRGPEGEDEAAIAAPTDRADWEKRKGKATVALADQLLAIVKEFDPSLEFRFNKFYIGITKNGKAFNFVSFVPQTKTCKLQMKIPYTEELENSMKENGLEVQAYDKQFGYYNVSLAATDVTKHREFLQQLVKQAYDIRSS